MCTFGKGNFGIKVFNKVSAH
uniref:Uncharacterized protein n=1 Tax=Lepeophtheirus salmonis TaxID=72036 RepID=A0A0K2U166_LEPSM